MKPVIALRRFLSRKLTPARSFVASFLLVILAGTLLLLLPVSTVTGRPLPVVDALFTSASAVCVTGLTVIDIGRDLSLFGQIVTLVLFQIGGLGIITFSLVLFGLMGRSLSFRGRELLQSTFLHTPRRDFFRILRFVVAGTFAIEAAGALLLFVRFLADFPPAQAFYRAVYHSVSAFNNCGYSLFSSSLIRYRGDWLVNLTVVSLVVLGGIGFIVLYEVLRRIRNRRQKLSLHSKLVLLTTGVLIAGGALLLYLFEAGNALKQASAGESFLASLFQSVTARTCGFNTVPIASLSNATLLVLMILMFIGASPGSTGGGVKTSSFALLVLMIANRIRGRDGVTIFRRTVPAEILVRTITIVIAASVAILAVASLLLLAAGPAAGGVQASRHLFVEYVFETISAFGTVGLSLGVTPELNQLQRLAVVLLMFAGRVGPLTMAFAWSSSRRGLVYAEEGVMVG
jgi:trk system potassium uptake protein TrkH